MKSRHLWKLAFMGVFLLSIVVMAAGCGSKQASDDSKKSEGASGSSEEIVYADGIDNQRFSKLGDFMIYIGAGNTVNSMKIDGSEKKQLKDSNCGYLNVQGDWIYFTYSGYMDPDNSGICRMKADGSGFQVLGKGEQDDECLCVAGDWIYYSSYNDGNKLYRMKTDGSGKQKLSDAVSTNEFIVSGDSIFFYVNKEDSYGIYRMGTDGGGLKKLSADAAYNMLMSGDRIYYVGLSSDPAASFGDYALYSIKTDGSDKKTLVDSVQMDFNIAGDWIYFWKGSEDITLCRMKIGSDYVSKLDAIKVKSPIFINIFSDAIYYGDTDSDTMKTQIFKVDVEGKNLQLFE